MKIKMKKNIAVFAIMVFSAVFLAGMIFTGPAEAGGHGGGGGTMPWLVSGTPPFFGQNSWSHPQRMVAAAVDSSGDVFALTQDAGVCPSGMAMCVAKYDANGNELTAWSKSGLGSVQYPYDSIAVYGSGSSEFVYVLGGGNEVVKLDSNGNYLGQWGSSGTGAGQFGDAWGIAVDASGYVYVADINNNRIEEFDSNGNFVRQWGSLGTGAGQFEYPQGIAADPSSGNVYVYDNGGSRIQEFDSNGNYLNQWNMSQSLAGMGGVSGKAISIEAIAADASGNVYAGTPAGISELNTAAGSWVSWPTDYPGYDQFNVHHSQGASSATKSTSWFTSSGPGTDIVAVSQSGNAVYDASQGGSLGQCAGTATFEGTFMYNGQPVAGAYLYFQPGSLGSPLPPMEQYFHRALFIAGPTDSNGNFITAIPPGAWHIHIMKRSSADVWNNTIYGPPVAGDYVWDTGDPAAISVYAGQTVDLGTVNATIYSAAGTTISGTVASNGKPMIGWLVKASTGPFSPLYTGGEPQFPNANSTLVKAVAYTDSNGNYTLNLPDLTASYYITACSKPRGCQWWGYLGGYGVGSQGTAQATSVSGGQQETGVNINVP